MNRQELLNQYHITAEQFDRVTYCVANGRHPFFIVESQTTPGVEYHVEYSRQLGKLTCNCPAGANGRTCWHMRAAAAAQAEYREEQERIEQEQGYEFEQALHDLETALIHLDALEVATKWRDQEAERKQQQQRKEEEQRRHIAPLNGNKPFSLLR